MVTELPWDEKTGTLRRDLAAGMMNPACKHALEAALQMKEHHPANITVITMGPPAAEEVLREALALGADKAVLVCDRLLAGSDTFATSLILKEAIKKKCPKFDLILCGAYTADSETAQVGPQLAEELDLPAAAYVEKLEISGKTLRVRRLVDNFRETLEMEFPALVTLGLTAASIEKKGSRTKVRKVFLRKTQKGNVLLQGAASAVVTEFLDKYQRKIGTPCN